MNPRLDPWILTGTWMTSSAGGAAPADGTISPTHHITPIVRSHFATRLGHSVVMGSAVGRIPNA